MKKYLRYLKRYISLSFYCHTSVIIKLYNRNYHVLNKFYGYQVIQDNHQLKIQYGLFTKKNITVPTDRLQGVLEHQSFIRKLFGYTSIHFYITSDIDTTEGTH